MNNDFTQPTRPGAIDKTSGTPSGFPDHAFQHDGVEGEADPTLILIDPWNLKVEGDYEVVGDFTLGGDQTLTGRGSGNGFLPAGVILQWATATAPSGYLICNGSAISRTTYANLFAVISTDYGVGDGSTTFNIPDYRGIFLRGAGDHGSMTKADATAFGGGTVGDENNDQMQQITGTLSNGIFTASDGALENTLVSSNGFTTGTANDTRNMTFDSASSTAQGGARTGDETNPGNIAVNFIIKT